jgi:hypothetical protein
MQEPLFKRKRTYYIVFGFFVLLAILALRENIGRLPNARSVLSTPESSQASNADESEKADYKIEETDNAKIFTGGNINLSVPKLWSLGMILYRPSEPNIILAMSNSVDLGSSTSVPAGVVRGKLQLSTRGYAVEFDKVEDKDFLDSKSRFWIERKKIMETNTSVKVTHTQEKFGDTKYVKEEMKVSDKKNNVDATKWTFYRLIDDEKVLAVEWSWEGKVDPSLESELKEIMAKLKV